jgi:maltose O-acetyltransferase
LIATLIRKLINLLRKIYNKSTNELIYSKYQITNRNFILGENVKIYGDGNISVGNGSYCGDLCSFQAVKGQHIKIGDNVSISHNVRIYTSNRNTKCFLTGEGDNYLFGDVTIGNNVWIGANVFIVQGVEIEDNVVVGANAVITKNVCSGSIVGGVPAKIIKKY